MIEGYEFWQLFPLIHRTGCYPTICYDCNYNVEKKEYEITIHSVDGLPFVVFENSFIAEINMGFELIQAKVNELSDTEATNLITELRRGTRQCRSFIKEQRVGKSVYEYFLHARFEARESNENYQNMISDLSFLSNAKAKSGLVIDPDEIKRFNQLILHIHAVRFTRVFMNVLDQLEARIEQMNIYLQDSSLLSDKEKKEYELFLINKHSSKELTYLFNLLYRIGFYELREGENEKLYRLIAGIYKSKRGSKVDKAKTVKKDWNNSDGHAINESFVEKFIENVLKEMTILAINDKDKEKGYNPKRMKK